ncbi:antitoxin MazE family protein [Agrobacterium vaccinii]|uniref:antitoxin MazE family protein n=1 Tax=Agrobacterium vaccinii TaxID=2735528 RepID=UPI001E598E86|nr:antitoxin MazE family protein [Agrobacterium vaccinii]UHS56237.1 antitoxin MazE family protein [Agrobacterium vaccinii]
MATSVNHRVQKRRDALRASGLRPVQIWVPDTRRPGFAEECLRQSKAVAVSDAFDTEFDAFADAALTDLDNEAPQ